MNMLQFQPQTARKPPANRPHNARKTFPVFLCFALGFFGFGGSFEGHAAEPNPAASLVSRQDSKKPIEINADNLTVHQKEHIAIFTGKVEAIQGTVNLRSDEMVVYYRENKQAQASAKTSGNSGMPGAAGGISRIDVNGNVFLATPEETASGTKGVYDVDKQEITLTGKVIITKGKNVIEGTKLVYNLNSGKSDMTSEATGNAAKKRVSSVFVPENNTTKTEAKISKPPSTTPEPAQ